MYKSASKHLQWLAKDKNDAKNYSNLRHESSNKCSFLPRLVVGRLIFVDVVLITGDKIHVTVDNGNIKGELDCPGALPFLKDDDRIIARLDSKTIDNEGKIYIKTHFVRVLKSKEGISGSMTFEEIYNLVLYQSWHHK